MASPITHLHRVVGPMSTIEVFERDGYRCLRFAGGGGLVQGRMHLTRPLDFGSAYLAPTCAATLAAATPRHALCLGLGVGALPRLLRAMWPDVSIDVVEIDPGIVTAARRFFDLTDGPMLRIIEADAARFVEAPPPGPAYDMIVIDCYDGDAIPAPLTRPAFFRSALALLAPGGVLAANVVTTRPGSGAAAGALAGSLVGPCTLKATGRSNQIWFGGRTSAPDLRHMKQAARRMRDRVPLDLEAALRSMRRVG